MPGYETTIRSVICQATGTWSPPPPTACSPIDCGQPPLIANAIIRVGGTRFGDVRFISCEPGFALSGPSNITCTQNGWSDAPICIIPESDRPTNVVQPVQPGQCDVRALPQIANGVWNSPGQAGVTPVRAPVPAGSIVTAVCLNPCYAILGNSVARCLPDGTFNTSTAPVCIMKQCGPLPTVMHSTTSPADVSNNCGTRARYVCNTGFIQLGPEEIECGSDGQWKFLGGGSQTVCFRSMFACCFSHQFV